MKYNIILATVLSIISVGILTMAGLTIYANLPGGITVDLNENRT